MGCFNSEPGLAVCSSFFLLLTSSVFTSSLLTLYILTLHILTSSLLVSSLFTSSLLVSSLFTSSLFISSLFTPHVFSPHLFSSSSMDALDVSCHPINVLYAAKCVRSTIGHDTKSLAKGGHNDGHAAHQGYLVPRKMDRSTGNQRIIGVLRARNNVLPKTKLGINECTKFIHYRSCSVFKRKHRVFHQMYGMRSIKHTGLPLTTCLTTVGVSGNLRQ